MLGRLTAQLRENLVQKVEVLKKNRQNISLDVLKTQYKASYSKLCSDIKCLSTEYFSACLMKHIHVKEDYFAETATIINEVIADSDLKKKLSKAAFTHQDVEEFDSIVSEFLDQLSDKMEPFYEKYSIKYFTDDPDVYITYCRANQSIKVGGRWFELSMFQIKEE